MSQQQPNTVLLSDLFAKVLLGEGYYAERTSKQTVDILMRRGKELDSQVDSLNAILADLKFEASFIDSTASEAAVMPKFNSLIFLIHTLLNMVEILFLCLCDIVYLSIGFLIKSQYTEKVMLIVSTLKLASQSNIN